MRKSITILGLKIKIIETDLTGTDYDGLYNGKTKTILIEKTLKGKYKQQILLHEIMHALFDRAGIHQLKISSDAEEILCEQISLFLVEQFNLKV